MNISWMFGLLLFIQFHTASLPENLTIESEGESIASMERAEYQLPFPGMPLIDFEKYNQFLSKLDDQTYIPPVNAYIDDAGRIISEKPGRKLHRKAFTDLFFTYFYEKGPARAEVPMLAVYPRVDRDLIAHIRVKQIGQYATYFNPNNKTRSHNIKLAAEAINNHVVFPGETFSLLTR